MRVGRADGESWLRLSEAASLLGISLNTLRRWSDAGKLVCYRSPGGHRRYRRNEIEALLSRQSGTAEQDARRGVGQGSPPAATVDGETHSPLATLTQLAAEGISVSSCVLAKADDEGRLRVVAAHVHGEGRETPRCGDVLTREIAPVADEVQHTRRRVVIADVGATNLLTPAEVEGCRRRGEAAVLALPLIGDGRLVGVLQLLEHRAPRAFTGANIAFAEFVARLAAGLIANEVPGDGARAVDEVATIQSDGSRARVPEETPDTDGDEALAPPASAAIAVLAQAATERGVALAGAAARLGRLIEAAAPTETGQDLHVCLQAFRRLVESVAPGSDCTVHAVSGTTVTTLPRDDEQAPASFALADDTTLAAAVAEGTPRVGRREGRDVLVLPLTSGPATVGICEVAGPSQNELLALVGPLAPAARLLGVTLATLGVQARQARRVRDLETIVRAGIEDAARLGTDELLHGVTRRLAELTHSPVADVYAVEGGTLRALISYDGGRFDPEWEGVVVPLARYPCSLRAVESGEIAVATSLDAEILGPDGRFSLERWGYQSQLSMPLVAEGRVIGLVELSDYEPRDFGDDLELVRGLGRVAAQALENARLFELVERRSRILNELVDLGTFASTCRDLDTVLRRVAERLLTTLGAANCDIYRADGDILRCAVSYDRSGFDEEAVGTGPRRIHVPDTRGDHRRRSAPRRHEPRRPAAFGARARGLPRVRVQQRGLRAARS